jgi:hypothetical protein
MSEMKPTETKPEKMVSRSVAIALGIICIVLVGVQVSQLNSTVTNLQNLVNGITSILSQDKLYVHSQLLRNHPQEILANSNVGSWVLNWTPTTNIRVIRVQVWMGNPTNVTWEGDTYVTIGGEPSDPSSPSSYNDTIQLLVHYQFDSHAPSPIPHQLMFDLTPGFKVASGQTIYVYRDFVNIEPYNVTSGDVQVIIYYENS